MNLLPCLSALIAPQVRLFHQPVLPDPALVAVIANPIVSSHVYRTVLDLALRVLFHVIS